MFGQGGLRCPEAVAPGFKQVKLDVINPPLDRLRDGRPVLGLVLPFWVVRAAHGLNHFLIGFGSCFRVLFLALALGLTSVPISNGPEMHELSPLLASLSD